MGDRPAEFGARVCAARRTAVGRDLLRKKRNAGLPANRLDALARVEVIPFVYPNHSFALLRRCALGLWSRAHSRHLSRADICQAIVGAL
jgi:hypothetical protein